MSRDPNHAAGAFTPRAVCYRCFKPAPMCVCARLERVDNRTGVLLLQHPRERLHPIGTARFAQLGLRKVRVEVAWNAGTREHQPPAWLPEHTALLFPAAAARALPSLPAREQPRHLLVLDGTWHTVRTLYRDKTWLQRLPHVRFTPASPSRYRLRREPAQHCVSTIEAIVEALRVLEPETQGLDALLEAFDAMIDDQLVHVLRAEGRPRRRRMRPRAQRRLPQAIATGLARIVVVYAESVRVDLRATRELCQVTACAVGHDAEFQYQLRPAAGVPSALLLAHMQLEPADFAGAIELGAFRERWRRFAFEQHARPIIAAWNQSTLELLANAGVALPERLLLKSAYRGRCGTGNASLEDVITAERLSPSQNALRGRAAWRIACAVAVVRHLHGLQHSVETHA